MFTFKDMPVYDMVVAIEWCKIAIDIVSEIGRSSLNTGVNFDDASQRALIKGFISDRGTDSWGYHPGFIENFVVVIG